ncbi:MAG: hypothetical protein WCC59_05135 [Terriglobales bacterium]
MQKQTRYEKINSFEFILICGSDDGDQQEAGEQENCGNIGAKEQTAEHAPNKEITVQ